MTGNSTLESKHFSLEQLESGVYVCIHKPGGGAFSNAGIIDLGERTILVDAFDTMAAGSDLRRTAETLFERPVDTIVLTHPHSDHWIGAIAFDEATALMANKKTRQVCCEWGENILKGFENPEEWEEWVTEMEEQLQSEKDESVRIGLEKSISRTRYTIAEMDSFQPRYADQTFEGTVIFNGEMRNVEVRSMGRGHSEDDTVLFLHEERIAFIGDIGFFDSQPFLGFSDIDLYRNQMQFIQDCEFDVLVPGHGPVGGKDDIVVQLEYMNIMEEMVGDVVQKGGSFDKAMQISLPKPFNKWLIGGMGRFEANVRYLFSHFGGEMPEEG